MPVLTSTTDSEAEIRRALEAAGEEVVSVDTETLGNSETETAAEAVPAAQAAPAATPSAPAASETPGAPETPPTQKEKTGLQERFDDLTREKYERTRRIEALEQEIAAFKQGKTPEAPAVTPPATAPAPEEKPRPQLDQFDDTVQYLEALGGWNADRLEAKLRYEIREQFEARGQQQSITDQAVVQRLELIEAGRTEFPDWDQVAKGTNVVIAGTIIDAIYDDRLGDGAAVLRYLVLHPEENAKVTERTQITPDMPPVEAVRRNRAAGREFARIAAIARVPSVAPPVPPPSQPAKPKSTASAAPEPITPVRGSAPAKEFDPHDPETAKQMTTKEYFAWRNRQSTGRR